MEINKCYNENCLDTMAKMPDGFIDLTVTSPPYDNLRTYNGYSFDFEAVAKELFRVTKQGGVVVWVVGDATLKGSETGTSFKQALYFKEIGFNLHDTMIYSKTGMKNPSNTRYHQTFEYMFVFSKGKPKSFNPLKDRKNKYVGVHGGEKSFRDEYGMRFNVWQYANGGNNTSKDDVFSHPAVFPEALANDHIISWSNEGEVVYDPFMGSGTTAKMAIINKRNWIGSEISEEYCKIIERRITIKLCGRQSPHLEIKTMVDETSNTEQSRVAADCPNERLVILQNSLQSLRDLTQVQCTDGNWNCDPYMHGMANGMIFALSLFEAGEPKYLDAPAEWLKDRPTPEVVSEASAT